MKAETVKRLAKECGFELAGVASADAPAPDFDRYQAWVSSGMAGEMGYLTDRRADLRRDVRTLLPNARSVICVGMLYNNTASSSLDQAGSQHQSAGEPVISRYASGRDYHLVLREKLQLLVEKLLAAERFDWKICVDTAPLLERSLARQAGLGWIGKNTCLINEPMGSWFFLGGLVTSLELTPDSPPPDRCGTCTRCIDACPTNAFVLAREPHRGDAATCESHRDEASTRESRSADASTRESRSDDASMWTLDARKCISYFTIELHGAIPEEYRAAIGPHIFGCDICQDVCPWNSRAPETHEEDFLRSTTLPPAETLARLTGEEFRKLFAASPIARPKLQGFLRNLAVAMGNAGTERYREPLEHLAQHTDPIVAEHAKWALAELDRKGLPSRDGDEAALDRCLILRADKS